MIDAHIHLMVKDADPEKLLADFDSAGVDAGVVLSLPPEGFFTKGERYSAAERLEHLSRFCGDTKLYPFFWLDPIADDAEAQVDKAVESGVLGFKIICDRFYPSDDRAMSIYAQIARAGKPILFHSGILWDGKVSSKFNHPIEFECLLEVPDLKFALAHISWPWCDELLALYGKFLNAYKRSDVSAEMFIDTTPGTPAIYREDALTRLYTVGYDVENNIMFGSDAFAEDYSVSCTKEWIDRDSVILEKIGVSEERQNKYFSKNAARFLNVEQVD